MLSFKELIAQGINSLECLALAGSDVFFDPCEVAMGLIQDSRDEVAGINAVLLLVHGE